ncbi:GTPase Der [Spirochaetia bacterium]|nr:GTPase Der [Spirochaetia bacterium]
MFNDNLPSVVLAGRPNVGKSTLFNRLAHKRRVITDPTPGVTRDPVEMTVYIAEKQVRLIDTGGFKLDREKPDSAEVDLEDIVVERTLQKIESADLVVLLFAAGEITAEDEEFIEKLRPLRNKLLAVVNKTEGGRLVNEAWNLASYGFDSILMISAEHGDNISELEKAIIKRLDFSAASESDIAHNAEPVIRIAIVGKPNTGKSTLSNRLTASSASIVSDIPGTTRDVVEGHFTWNNKHFFVLDTAGIRRKSKIKENIEYYSVNRAIKTMEDADLVVLLIDAQEGLADQDKKIASLACEKGRPVIFALNKWDTMGNVKNTFNAVCDKIHYFFGQMEYAPIIALSAKDGGGVKELLNTVIKVYQQVNKKTETSVFNKALEKWQVESPPPSGPSTRFKIKYGLQISANPVRFRLFVSRHRSMTTSYTSYICNKIRKDLDYSMIPIILEVYSSSKTERVENRYRGS